MKNRKSMAVLEASNMKYNIYLARQLSELVRKKLVLRKKTIMYCFVFWDLLFSHPKNESF